MNDIKSALELAKELLKTGKYRVFTRYGEIKLKKKAKKKESEHD